MTLRRLRIAVAALARDSVDPQLVSRRWPERRSTVLAAAAAAFVAVAVAQRANGDPALALGLLYVLPVMLLALELGLVGGCTAAVLAIALLVAIDGQALDALGVATRSVAVVAVGGIAGRFSDQMRDAHAREEQLMAQEREASAVEAELLRVRDDLLEQRSGLGRLLDAQEDERRRVAETLHEDLAQVLAAVLLGLRILRHEAPESSGLSLDDLHGQVVGVLADVREVARALLPASLAQLGLVPALEALAEDLHDRHLGGLEIDAGGVPEPLPDPLRTGVYRLVEQAMTAHVARRPAHLRLSVDAGELDMTLALEVEHAAEPFAAARARAALLGGTLEVEPAPAGTARMRIRLPLPGADRRGQVLTSSAQ